MISAVKTGLRAWYAGGDEFFCEKKPFLRDIISDGVAGFLFELAHHMVFTDIEMPGQRVDGQIPVKMLIDILEDLDDFGITIVRINEFQPVFCCTSIKMDHKL